MSVLTKQSIYSFQVNGLQPDTKINFSDFKGKKILIVNTASECGFTPQYQQLQDLHENYKDKLVIIGFPANNFGSQEPGNNEQIAAFCKKNYGVTFPMAAKISVKGNDIHPLYQWLTKKELNGHSDIEVTWNFQKYLIDEEGKLTHVFQPQTEPLSEEVLAALDIKLN